MNINQIIDNLPPLVYMRRGELVIQFATPADDLVCRLQETSAALCQAERSSVPENKSERTGRGKPAARSNARSTTTSQEVEDRPEQPEQ